MFIEYNPSVQKVNYKQKYVTTHIVDAVLYFVLSTSLNDTQAMVFTNIGIITFVVEMHIVYRDKYILLGQKLALLAWFFIH